MKYLNILFIGVFALFSCTMKNDNLMEGSWRATLLTESGIELPFNFEVQKAQNGSDVLYIINGEERFLVDEIEHVDDSVFIKLPIFDSEIKAKMNGHQLEGKWIKYLAQRSVAMNFNAKHGEDFRFEKKSDPGNLNLSGRWAVSFETDSFPAVGEFTQKGSKLTGTFLTATGDYRYLEGSVHNNKFQLSCFNGSHAFLFTGDITDNNTIENGKFYSGYSYIENWKASKDENAKLPDAYSLTYFKEGYTKIEFSYPDLDKNMVSLTDERFKNKVVVLQLMGSWCPNCMDETAFLSEIYKKYQPKGFEIIGLAYERNPEFEAAKRNVIRLKQRFDVTYPLLLTGVENDKAKVAESLPALNKFLSFPTTIVIDKNGNVRQIHTGFSGPGTGKYYDEYVLKFTKLIEDLLNE